MPFDPNITSHIRQHLQRKILNHKSWVKAYYHSTASQETGYPFPYTLKNDVKGSLSGREFQPIKKIVGMPENTDTTDPIYLISMIHHFGTSTADAQLKLKTMFQQFSNEAFHDGKNGNPAAARKRLVINIGINRAHSIDPTLNRQFEEGVKSIVLDTSIPYRLFAQQWKPKWSYSSCSYGCNTYSPEKSFLLIKALTPAIAPNVLRSIEVSSQISSQIPYQDLRQWVKAHPETSKIITTVKTWSDKLYFVTMDDDFQALRVDKGQFTIFDEQIKRKPIDLITTGYTVPTTAPRLLQAAIKLDMNVRAAMARHFPLAPYYPEPCMALKVPDIKTFHLFSYTGGNNLESRRLVQSAIDAGSLKDENALFLSKAALVTSIPSRMLTVKIQESQVSTTADLHKKQNLQTLHGGVSQSHVAPLKWAEQIYTALPGKSGSVHLIKTPLTKILRVFDPITLTTDTDWGQRYTTKLFSCIANLYPDYSSLAYAFLSGKETQELALRKIEALVSVKILGNIAKTNLLAAFKLHFEGAKTAIVALKSIGIDDESINKVILAAQSSGMAIHSTLTDESLL